MDPYAAVTATVLLCIVLLIAVFNLGVSLGATPRAPASGGLTDRQAKNMSTHIGG
jgi:hypothetical protein